MARRRRRGRRGRTTALTPPPIGPDGLATRPKLALVAGSGKRRSSPTTRQQSEHRRIQVDFFTLTRTEALLKGVRNVRQHVRDAWVERFGEELSLERYSYLCWDSEHDQQRAASLERVFGDVAQRVVQGPVTHLAANLERTWDFLETLATDPRMRCVTGSSVQRVRNAAGEWEDVAVVHDRLPESVLKEGLKLVGRLAETRTRLALVSEQAAARPSVAVAGVNAGGAHAQVNVVVGKATPFAPREGDDRPAGSPFTHAQIAALIAQESEPFAIPKDDSISYEEHVRMQKMALYEFEAKQAAGLLPPLENAAGPAVSRADEARRAREVEMMRGVVLDPGAVADADVAARSIPDHRS